MIEKRKKYNITNFTPENQDRFCIVLFKHKRKGMLELITQGKIQEATETYGSYEWTTDHYILIVARYCENSQLYYQFWDVGTRTGSDKKYRFKLTEKGHLVSETTHSGKTYTVTQIRRTTKISKK